MVADKVDVFSKSSQPNSVGFHWSSDGFVFLWSDAQSQPKIVVFLSRTGTYELSEDNSVEVGTKIVIHLKSDCTNFSEEDTIKGLF